MKRITKVCLLVLCVLWICLLPLRVEAADSGSCGKNLTWTVTENGVLCIRGSGEMSYSGVAPWQSVTFTEVDVQGSNITIPYRAFYNRTEITKVTLAGVKELGMYAFYGCTNLTEVNLGGSMTTLRDNAFEECTALKTVVLPDSLTYIGSYAFHNCKALESVSVPGSVDILPSSVFAGCSALQTATLGEGITSLGAYTFEKCSALTSIFLPSTLTQIANQAFYSCSSLKTVAYAGSREQWRDQHW